MRAQKQFNSNLPDTTAPAGKGETAMKALTIAGAVTSSLLVATALTPARAADMTFERSLNVGKEPQNWLLHHGNYEGWRFSQLKQINTDTFKNLKPVFSVALGGFESGGRYKFGNLEGTPLVEDGVMYVTDGWGSVYAIDVTSGKRGTIRWKFDPATGETITMAPLVVRDIAIVGAAGGEFGIRGYVDGTDLNTGKQVWRTYTIPGTNEPGNETWKDGKDRWKHGGGSVWETATYD